MTETSGAANTILKILSGVQSGVEVSLASGTYTLGSGSDDDIQIIDVSLKPSHLKLRISPGKVELAAADGSLKSANGIVLEVDSDFQEIEPLDVVTAGTTRFALGPPTALWASIAEIDKSEQQAAPARKRRSRPAQAGTEVPWLQRARKLAIPIAALVALAIFSAWQLSAARIDTFGFTRSGGLSDLELTTAAVAQFPFARNIAIRQEVDGTIYVNGYVETPVERRAVAGAVEKTAIPARVRIWVLQSLRSEVENLAKSENVNITSTISPGGELVLDGVVLSEETAARFIDLVRDRILGIANIDSRIRTSKTLLGEVEKLAQVSQIHQWVLLRDAREVIEANGAIPVEKIDAWAGFLQAYARRFAKDIGLRSYVQLQTVSMTMASSMPRDQAFVIGGPKTQASDVTLDVERLKQGNFAPRDVLLGAPSSPEPASAAAAAAGDGAQRDGAPLAGGFPGPRTLASDLGPLLGKDDARLPRASVTLASATIDGTASVGTPRSTESIVSAQNDKSGADDKTADSKASDGKASDGKASGSGSPAVRPAADGDLTIRARHLLEEWREHGLKRNGKDEAFRQALERLQRNEKPGAAADSEKDRQQFAERYLPLFNVRRTAETGGNCWTESHLSPTNLPAALFWLDLLSVSEQLSLATFDQEMQTLLLEAALNPKRAQRCAQKLAGGPAAASKSLYLTEIARNPDFVRFITRDLQPFTLDITGASIGQQARFIQVRSGRKLHEGAAPSRASRLAAVGELGVAIQVKDGLSTVVFGQGMTWLAE